MVVKVLKVMLVVGVEVVAVVLVVVVLVEYVIVVVEDVIDVVEEVVVVVEDVVAGSRHHVNLGSPAKLSCLFCIKNKFRNRVKFNFNYLYSCLRHLHQGSQRRRHRPEVTIIYYISPPTHQNYFIITISSS